MALGKYARFSESEGSNKVKGVLLPLMGAFKASSSQARTCDQLLGLQQKAGESVPPLLEAFQLRAKRIREKGACHGQGEVLANDDSQQGDMPAATMQYTQDVAI